MTTPPHTRAGIQAPQMTTRLHRDDIFTGSLQPLWSSVKMSSGPPSCRSGCHLCSYLSAAGEGTLPGVIKIHFSADQADPLTTTLR